LKRLPRSIEPNIDYIVISALGTSEDSLVGSNGRSRNDKRSGECDDQAPHGNAPSSLSEATMPLKGHRFHQLGRKVWAGSKRRTVRA
jgi:hypothetical protein